MCLLETYCTSCESVLKYSSDRVSGVAASNVPFVVTRSVVSATMDMGVGYGGLVRLCRHFDMSAMTSKMYTSRVKVVASASMVATSSLLDDAVEVVRSTYIDRGLSTPTEHGIIDLAVSFDGTWMTRGHSSKYGLGFMVEIETGLVLDFVSVLPQLCWCRCTLWWRREGGVQDMEDCTHQLQRQYCRPILGGGGGGGR